MQFLNELIFLIVINSFGACSDHARLMGGLTARKGAFPYLVALVEKNKIGCVGSIIDKQWILTAGHCIFGHNPQDMKVIAGTNIPESGNGEEFECAEFRVHEDFSPKSPSNDIGLIKLATRIHFSYTTKRIELAYRKVAVGKKLILAGWGTTKLSEPQPTLLKVIVLTSISNKECEQAHGPIVKDTNMCTRGSYEKGVCYGDSGGPLVYQRTQVGIVSWSIPCAVGKPDVFTDVSKYRSWIEYNKKDHLTDFYNHNNRLTNNLWG